jgi:hypothetical protein
MLLCNCHCNCTELDCHMYKSSTHIHAFTSEISELSSRVLFCFALQKRRRSTGSVLRSAACNYFGVSQYSPLNHLKSWITPPLSWIGMYSACHLILPLDIASHRAWLATMQLTTQLHYNFPFFPFASAIFRYLQVGIIKMYVVFQLKHNIAAPSASPSNERTPNNSWPVIHPLQRT